MNKSKRSVLTAISSMTLMLLNGLFALFVTKRVIIAYGSDFNGLNSTTNQFIGMLLLIEGGFTIATNVALFKPIADNNYRVINGILSATKKTFNKIGMLFFFIGTVLSIVYTLFIKSELSPLISFIVFFMAIISTSFNLLYATKYSILLQSENKEYILNSIKIGTAIFSQSLIIINIYLNGHMLGVRFATMLGAIINSILIASITKKRYEYIDFNVEPDYKSIKGTKDIVTQKITGVIYSTLPVIFITVTAGTIFASIYAIYNYVFNFLKSIIYSFINAPRMSLGRLIAEKDSEYVFKIFLQYQFVTFYIMFIMLSTATVLIIPFISIYTNGITDANYYDWSIAVFLICITFFEVIHIPSGNIINMAGKFKVGRKIQTLASIVLVIAMIIGNDLLGFYGILLAVLITAVLLAVLEIFYTHHIYFNGKILEFFKLLVPSFAVMIFTTIFEITVLPQINTYLEFMIIGAILVIINALVLAMVNLITNRDIFEAVIIRVKGMLKV